MTAEDPIEQADRGEKHVFKRPGDHQNQQNDKNNAQRFRMKRS